MHLICPCPCIGRSVEAKVTVKGRFTYSLFCNYLLLYHGHSVIALFVVGTWIHVILFYCTSFCWSPFTNQCAVPGSWSLCSAEQTHKPRSADVEALTAAQAFLNIAQLLQTLYLETLEKRDKEKSCVSAQLNSNTLFHATSAFDRLYKIAIQIVCQHHLGWYLYADDTFFCAAQ